MVFEDYKNICDVRRMEYPSKLIRERVAENLSPFSCFVNVSIILPNFFQQVDFQHKS